MHKNFCGIAVHPARVSPNEATLVGVWLPWDISPQQSREIKGLNSHLDPDKGILGVRINAADSTAVTFIGRMQSPKDARKNALSLAKIVAEVTGAHSILRQLPNYRTVSRTLAS